VSIPIPWIEIDQVELDALRYVQAVCKLDLHGCSRSKKRGTLNTRPWRWRRKRSSNRGRLA
jgi:hypothetical protein